MKDIGARALYLISGFSVAACAILVCVLLERADHRLDALEAKHQTHCLEIEQLKNRAKIQRSWGNETDLDVLGLKMDMKHLENPEDYK